MVKDKTHQEPGSEELTVAMLEELTRFRCKREQNPKQEKYKTKQISQKKSSHLPHSKVSPQ